VNTARRPTALLFPGGVTNASNGRHQRRNVNNHNRTRQPPTLESRAMTSVAVVHRNPSGYSESVVPRRDSLRSTTTGSINIDCQDSVGTALDSGVSGMDVSTSVTQEDMTNEEFSSSAHPVYISVMVASTTPTDESVVSSMSISGESNCDEDDNVSSMSPIPTLLYESDINSGVQLPSNGDTPLDCFDSNVSANVSDELILSSVRSRRMHHNKNADENYDTSDTKRSRFAEQRPIRFPGSPHPRRAAIPSCLVPIGAVVYRRRYSGDDPYVSSRQRSWRQQNSASETDATAMCDEVESPDCGSKIHVELFGTSHSQMEDGCEAVIGNSAESGRRYPTLQSEAVSSRAVTETHHIEVNKYSHYGNLLVVSGNYPVLINVDQCRIRHSVH